MLSTDHVSPELAEMRSPAELAEIADPAALRTAVSDYIRAKHWAHGYELLTPFEHTLRLAFECARHESRGTLLEEALRGRERCWELVAALEAIGARSSANALRRAHELCAAVPAEDAAKARSTDDWCILLGQEQFAELEAALIENEVADRLAAFVSDNKHRLQPD
ncbi:hypothetical protein LVJ94_51775 [Pendulispora rubella]|uniref:Uncharacterized protein n=1 Tax=Pendulispora rubella TaxID=2741070 RepID=A0ABZ2L4V1_9BACT